MITQKCAAGARRKTAWKGKPGLRGGLVKTSPGCPWFLASLRRAMAPSISSFRIQIAGTLQKMGLGKDLSKNFSSILKRSKRERGGKAKSKNRRKDSEKQWWSAQSALLLAHLYAVIGGSSCSPPFMISWKRLCCSICSMVCRSLSCSLFHAALFSICVCWFRITEQSLHPLRDPPIARLSESLRFAMCLCCFFRFLRALCLCCFAL